MRELKAAVVGCGWMGANHARIYADMNGVDLVAVADKVIERAAEVAKRHKAKAYGSAKELFEREVPDVVSIAVPSKFHKDVALEAMDYCKNVLVEKPIAVNSSDAKKIIDEAKRKNVRLMVGHIERFNPAVVELKKQIESGRIGRVFLVEVQRIGPFPSRIEDSGVTIDLAVHDIDILNYLFNEPVKKVFAFTGRKIHPNSEDLLTATLQFDSMVAVLNVNWLTPTKIRKLFVTGEKGMFTVNYLTQDLYFYENASIREGIDYPEMIMGIAEGNMIKLRVEKKEPLKVELDAFIESIRRNSRAPNNPEDALKAIATVEKIIESAKKGQVV